MKFSITLSAAALLLAFGMPSPADAGSPLAARGGANYQTQLRNLQSSMTRQLASQDSLVAQMNAQFARERQSLLQQLQAQSTSAVTGAINSTGYQSYLNSATSSITSSMPSISPSVSASTVLGGGCASGYVSGSGESACGRVDLGQLQSYLGQRSTGVVTPSGSLNGAYSQLRARSSIYLTGSMNSIVNQARGTAAGYVTGAVDNVTSQATNYLTTTASSYVPGGGSLSSYFRF